MKDAPWVGQCEADYIESQRHYEEDVDSQVDRERDRRDAEQDAKVGGA